MLWHTSFRAEPAAREIADRHYNRQAVGAAQFVPPGACIVLRTSCRRAVWVTLDQRAEFVDHDWPNAWLNCLFRNEGAALSSLLIRQAVAATLARWPVPPINGLVTFVDPAKVRRKRDPGRCYLRAGFRRVGLTKGGLVVLQLQPQDMPAPEHARGAQRALEEV
ncbi:MAG TPA: hypothetical protein VEA35_06820 [Ramlibacter sp.]|nr:hypothetical protein [Candidatus Limnocylindrales bacterium]HYF42148.1 hypothetical protein [Ramlibacter sp.]